MDLRRLLDWALIPVCALISYWFVVAPLTNDSRIFLGVEHIAANYYPFPQGIDLAWEIKPIFNRVINFVLYKIATLFVSFEDHFMFGVAVKLIVLAFVIFVAWYFARKVGTDYAFYLVFLSFVTMGNFCVMQAEYFSALLSLLAIAFLLSPARILNYCAGVLMACVFLTKGITGLFIVPVICGWFLLIDGAWEDAITGLPYFDEVKRFIAGFLAAGYAFYVMAVLYWHNLVSDILISPHLARVGSAPLLNILVWFVAQLVIAPLHIPVLLIGIVFGAIFFFAWVRYQDLNTRLAYEIMWIVPCLMVIIQGELFLYHYLAFVPTAIVTIVMCERQVKA